MFAGFSSAFAEFMSRRMQRVHSKNDVFRAIASFEEQKTLKSGDTVHRPFKTLPRVQDYTRGTAMTIGAHTETDESLVVNAQKVAPFYVDDLDQLQSNFNLRLEFAEEMAIELGNFIDGDVLGEYDQADNDVDDSDINPSTGTAGNGYTLDSSNVLGTWTLAKRKLDVAKVRQDNRFAVISPHALQVLIEYLASKDTVFGDKIGQNGRIGMYMGFEVFVSNSTGWSATLKLGSQVTEGDTVVINGVTFTFNATPSGAGSVDIGSDAATSVDNLVAAINDSGTAGTTYIQLSTADRKLMDKITATDGTTEITLKSEGDGTVAVSETLTAGADVWTPALQIQHLLFGRKGATDVVIQQRPKVEIKEVPDKLGKNVIPWTLYGLKTFDEGDAEIVDVNIRSDKF